MKGKDLFSGDINFLWEKLIANQETIGWKEMQLFKFPIIPVSKMTLMNGELARKCIQIENHGYF